MAKAKQVCCTSCSGHYKTRLFARLLTALHDEGVGLAALHVQLRDEFVVDPPGDAPAGVAGDGAVTTLAAGRPDAHGQLTVAEDRLRLPRLDRVLVRQVEQGARTRVVVLGAEVDADIVWKQST